MLIPHPLPIYTHTHTHTWSPSHPLRAPVPLSLLNLSWSCNFDKGKATDHWAGIHCYMTLARTCVSGIMTTPASCSSVLGGCLLSSLTCQQGTIFGSPWQTAQNLCDQAHDCIFNVLPVVLACSYTHPTSSTFLGYAISRHHTDKVANHSVLLVGAYRILIVKVASGCEGFWVVRPLPSLLAL